MTLLFSVNGPVLCAFVQCDTVLCPGAARTEGDATRALKIRTAVATEGWSTRGAPARYASADYCPACTTDHARRGDTLCTACPGGDLYDYLGHDLTGHRTANALYRCGVTDRADLAARDLRTLVLGNCTLTAIREALHAHPVIPAARKAS